MILLRFSFNRQVLFVNPYVMIIQRLPFSCNKKAPETALSQLYILRECSDRFCCTIDFRKGRRGGKAEPDSAGGERSRRFIADIDIGELPAAVQPERFCQPVIPGLDDENRLLRFDFR